MRRRDIINELKIALMVTGIGMGIFASMLLFGIRAKAATVRDGVNTPIFAELVTMGRAEREDMRNAGTEAVVSEVVEQLSNNSPEVGNNFGELDLLAAIVYAEAGDQGHYGMRLVCDVILNRIDYGYGSTVSEVVYAPGQFSPVTDGGLDRAWGRVTQECYDAVLTELNGPRIDYDILYFSMYGCQNGQFAFQYLDHYFGY